MRVLLTCKKRTWCGETRYVAELTNALIGNRHLVTVAARRESELWPFLSESAQRVTLHLEHDFLAVGKLTSDLLCLRRCLPRVDLVHTNASWDTWLVAWARKAFSVAIPFVRTRHNLKPIREHWGNRWLYRSAIDRVITPSRAIQEDTVRSRVVPGSSLRMARYGVDVRHFDPAAFDTAACRGELNSRLGAKRDRPKVILAGRLVPRKQPELFVEVARRLCSQGVDADFLVVGKGSGGSAYATALEELAADHRDRIHFLDFTSSIAELLAGCDISVLTAAREPFGLTVAEAMAMKVPVVASASGGPIEIIDHGVDGLLFEPGNVESCAEMVRSLLENPERRRSMAEKARQRVLRDFSWDRCLREHVQTYADLLQPANR